MGMRDVGRFLSMCFAVGVAGLTAVSCGTTNSSEFDAGRPDSSTFANDGSFGMGDANANPCTPKTCADQGFTCGMNGDGCGKVIDCGSCTAPAFCGGGGYSKCGTTPTAAQDGGKQGDAGPGCTPKTCEELGANCGWASDKCDGVVLCGSLPDGGPVTLAVGADAGVDDAGAADCPAPTICGGTTSNQCGGSTAVLADGGMNTTQCTPKPCPAGANCGQAGDGCGNIITCGGSCTDPEYCGGGGPNTCGGFNGVAPDGGVALPPCTPTTCAALGYSCGYAGDGCGKLLDCSGGKACPIPTYCGGPNGSTPNVCSGDVNKAADGGTINLCTPTKTCASVGFSCGQADDGCGHLLNCGSCSLPDTCGGAGVNGQCGHTCTGICQYQTSCDGGASTTITGTVYAAVSKWLNPNAPAKVPNPPDPVPNVLVYVPSTPLTAISQGYKAGQCPLCGADVSGSPLITTYTNFDGTFSLQNVPTPPAGQKVPVVIQLGRWRKEFQIDPPAKCQTTNIGALNLPANKTDGLATNLTNNIETTNIPLTAISTGNVDALECVLLKMGVDRGEFTADTGSGRIHVYAGYTGAAPTNGAPGATVANADPEPTLMNGTNGTYMNYDQLMFPCWGSAYVTKTADELASLITYADSGGHFFSTHYSYAWLVNNGEFKNVAAWAPDYNNPDNVTWNLNVSTVPPVAPAPMYSGIFYKWLNLVGALATNLPLPDGGVGPAAPPNTVNIYQPRHDANAVANGSLAWISGTDPDHADAGANSQLVEHFTFNTPVGQATQCGHAIFSDFHVTGSTAYVNGLNRPPLTFPNECDTNAMTAQERILEYMIFDLASCVTPPTSNCTPKSCAAQGLQCGETGDGCGNPLDCGTCAAPLTCGGGGQVGVCGEPDGGACTPQTSCTGKCGTQGDGCGGTYSCPCPAGTTCGGGGVANECGVLEAGSCKPGDCTAAGVSCGPAGDGCGNVIQCGGCGAGMTCGGGGAHGQCGTPDSGIACTPLTCASQNIGCGPTGDGCGGLLDCGTCPAGQTCGGGGVAGQCGGGGCVPYSCADLGFDCGPAGDGCGSIIQCGACTGTDTCGGSGHAGVCGTSSLR